MSKRTGPTNSYLKGLIENIRKKYFELNAPIWKAIAKKLEAPTRKRIAVNLSDIERNTKENDVIIVPGVVLASGNLNKKITIAAWKFSGQAKEKIKKSKSECITIEELMEKYPKGSGVKIIT